MSKRIIIAEAEHCPFCGCKKIFLKAFSQGVGEKRFAISLQCSKCHVNGPQVFSDWSRHLGSFENLPITIKNALINAATEKWNKRY